MRKLFTKSSLCISAGATVSGVFDHAEILEITTGKVWVTIEGSPDDHFLAAGDTLSIQPGRLIVIEADQQDSRVNLPNLHTGRGSFDFFAPLRALSHDTATSPQQKPC